MRQLAVFNDSLFSSTGFHNLSCLDETKIRLGDELLNIGLIKSDPISLPATASDSVLIKKLAFSCNFRDKGIATMAKSFLDEFAMKGQVKFYPIGSEFCGRVVEVGSNVHALKVGDRVIGNGNFPFSGVEGLKPGLPTNRGSKELEIFHQAKLIKIPDNMTDVEAAAFPIGGQTAYSMIRRLNLQENESVLITASSSNTSLFAINRLVNLPVKVYALTSSQKFVDRLHQLGVDDVFLVDRSEKSLHEFPKINSHIEANGFFDAVIDPFFDIYLKKLIHCMNFNSRYITCGFHNQISDKNNVRDGSLSEVLSTAMTRNISIMGNCIGKTQDLENALQDYKNNKLNVIIDSVFKGNEISQFLDYSFNRGNRFVKIIYQY